MIISVFTRDEQSAMFSRNAEKLFQNLNLEETALSPRQAISKPGTTATAVHHVGMSVASLDDALAFWEPCTRHFGARCSTGPISACTNGSPAFPSREHS